MKRRHLFSLFTFLLLLCLLVIPAAADELSGSCGESANWSFDPSTGTLTISGSGAMENTTTCLWDDLYYRNAITTVVVEEGITAIGTNAFKDLNHLKQVQLPASLVSIEEGAFLFCGQLSSIQFPDNLKSIGKSAFSGCGLKALVLPDSVTECGPNAFTECNYLTDIKLSKNLSVLEYDLFSSCDALTTVTIPAGVKELSREPFGHCSKLNSVIFLGDAPVFHFSAFGYCELVVRYPADNPTWTADKLQDYEGEIIWLPSGDAPITGTFGRWNLHWKLEKGTLTISGDGYMDGWNRNPPWYPYREMIKKVVLSGKLDNIYADAFAGCTKLTQIQWSNTIIAIHDSAFKDCTSLKTVTLPNSVRAIGTNAFLGCTSLTTVNLPASLESISCEVFTDCTSLKSLTIPSAVYEILSGAFNTDSLKTLYFKGNFPKTLNNSNADYTGSFAGFKGTVYYPADNASWTAAKIKEQTDLYGSKVKFVASSELNATSKPSGGSTTPTTPSTESTTPTKPSGGTTKPSMPSGATSIPDTTTKAPEETASDVTNPINESTVTTESTFPATTSSDFGTTAPVPQTPSDPADNQNSDYTPLIWSIVGLAVLAAGGIAVPIILKKRKT